MYKAAQRIRDGWIAQILDIVGTVTWTCHHRHFNSAYAIECATEYQKGK